MDAVTNTAANAVNNNVKVLAASGDQMVAEAFRQANPDVLPVYPITPQTIIVEEFDRYVAQGRVHTEFVPVESEHSAMAAAIGASSAGASAANAVTPKPLRTFAAAMAAAPAAEPFRKSRREICIQI